LGVGSCRRCRTLIPTLTCRPAAMSHNSSRILTRLGCRCDVAERTFSLVRNDVPTTRRLSHGTRRTQEGSGAPRARCKGTPRAMPPVTTKPPTSTRSRRTSTPLRRMSTPPTRITNRPHTSRQTGKYAPAGRRAGAFLRSLTTKQHSRLKKMWHILRSLVLQCYTYLPQEQ
jgi:hypothetical protein